ncbi:MAG: YqjK family protein [Candidatus Dactylopiibacterium sp.]|nr:YqjK family protein [Candidatus Dactylopiibacterium sp.]
MKFLSRREQLLAQRRRRLLADSRTQRAQIGFALSGVQERFARLQRLLELGRWVRQHSVVVGLTTAGLLAFRPTRRLMRMALRGWSLWRGWRALAR